MSNESRDMSNEDAMTRHAEDVLLLLLNEYYPLLLCLRENKLQINGRLLRHVNIIPAVTG